MSAEEKSFTLDLTMKSGAKVSVDVTEATYSRSVSGTKSLSWTTPDGWAAKLLHVDMDEIAAVVAVR